MKTPKVATPMPKLKLNTPRSGFIKKVSSSVKKAKINVLENSGLEINGTPKNDIMSFKKVKPGSFINSSPKKNKSPINNANKSPENKSILKTPTMSPLKRKVNNCLEEDGDENLLKKKKSPKNENKIEKTPGKKGRNDKASPEVQLGLDIEQFLHKNSTKSMDKFTPLGTKQLNKINKTINLKSKNQNKKKLKKQIENTLKSEGNVENELVPVVTLRNAVNALVKYVDKNPNEQCGIFGLEIPFYLQVNYNQLTTVKRSKILVPNTILPKNYDACLIVADKKGAEKIDPDDVIDDMRERLRKCGITKIPEIFPWAKASMENTQFEQKRKFIDRFDLILVEDKLVKIFSKWFGFTFTKNKIVAPVTLKTDEDLKTKIDLASKKIPVIFKGKGLTRTIRFGHDKMGVKELVENLDTILKEITSNSFLHGSKDMFKTISIKTLKSTSFPLYMNTTLSYAKTTKNEVEKSKNDVVEGELSTFTNTIVSVYKDGTVKTRKIKPDEEKNKTGNKSKNISTKEEDEYDEIEDDDDDDDDDEEEEEEEEEDDDEVKNLEFESDEDSSDETVSEYEENNSNKLKNKKLQKQKNIKGVKNNKVQKEEESDDDDDDESTDEDQLDAAEEIFLTELRRQQDNIESKKNTKKKVTASPPNQSKKPQRKVGNKQKGQTQNQNVQQKNEMQKNQNQQQQQNNKKSKKRKNNKVGKPNQDKNDVKDNQLDVRDKKYSKGINLQKEGKTASENQNKKPQEKVFGNKKLAQKQKNHQETQMNKENLSKTVPDTNKQSKNKRKRNKKKSNPESREASPQQKKVLTSPKVNPKGMKTKGRLLGKHTI